MAHDNRMTRTPGPTPGPDRAIRQHKAMASGVVLPKPERRVDMFQRQSETGRSRSPGITNRR